MAAKAAALVAGRLGTETGSGNELAGAMAVVRLPISRAATTERAKALRVHMLEAGTDVPLHAQAGALWLRLSVQAYNELPDYEKLAEIVRAVLSRHA
jgi:isopenicillin-N epimerase